MDKSNLLVSATIKQVASDSKAGRARSFAKPWTDPVKQLIMAESVVRSLSGLSGNTSGGLDGVMANQIKHVSPSLITPTVAALDHLLSICDEFASANDIVFNRAKTKCMAFILRGTPLKHIPMVWLPGVSLSFVGSYKYLGFTMAPTLSDELHVKALLRSLCCRANLLIFVPVASLYDNDSSKQRYSTASIPCLTSIYLKQEVDWDCDRELPSDSHIFAELNPTEQEGTRFLRNILTKEDLCKCRVCSKTFEKKEDLYEHMSSHNKKKAFECDICKKDFAQTFHLLEHQRTHTGEKPFKCDVCEKCFASSSSFSRHKRIHTGEKPFECNICKKTFTTSASLSCHQGTHADVKPFECDICQKTFRQKAHLYDHQRVHTGEKPFECDEYRYSKEDRYYEESRSMDILRRINILRSIDILRRTDILKSIDILRRLDFLRRIGV
ncbi:hypothetical protein QYM36_010350 [Artemia franciscana]|uniref:C2H2-type domain-containing protein n=1 Tax=Artemia franciscana TaxID=6661 RepID=A0AA88HTY5_ARTSF|nr:hypothetical protein QYM36_010350 [Artemia franciscana]